jgi:aquaporin Z
VAGDRVAGGEQSGATPSGAGPIGLRASQLLALEFGSKAEFDDPRLEWRRLFSEMLGTFLLVMVAAGGSIVHALAQISLAAAVVAPGLMVMAIILFMGAVSGAHLNPAVSVSFALRRDFPWNRLPGYVIVQLVGAALACLFLDAVFGNVHHLGATLPGPGYADWQALLLEVVLTAGLVSVVLGTASAAQNVGAIAALGVGGYIALAGLWSAPVSGASMNPARSFGPALVSGDFDSYWLYVVGPIAGAFIAVGCAWVLRGGGGDPTSYAAGSGRLGVNALREGRRLSSRLMHDASAPLRAERSRGSADPSPGGPQPAPAEAEPAPGAEERAPDSPGANEPPPS